MDAGNIMKPALARGDLRCIGATTIAEFRRSIDKDPAFSRRFQPIQVFEPGREATQEIRLGLRAHRESHYGVTIAEGAVSAAVDLSIRFDPRHTSPTRRSTCWTVPAPSAASPLSLALESDHVGPMGVAVVKPEVVARVVAEKMGIPIEVVRGRDGGAHGIPDPRAGGIPEPAHRRPEGMPSPGMPPPAHGHTGLGDRRRPLGVFLFLGPSGVGKTELARCMAAYLFSDERAFIRLDMSEYQEEASMSRLVGASPGYIGYEEGGQLTGRLRTTP